MTVTVRPTTATTCLTVDKDSEAQEVQVALTAAGVPADIRVSFGQEHRAALKATARQVGYHLGAEGGSAGGQIHTIFLPKVLVCPSLEVHSLIYLPFFSKQ